MLSSILQKAGQIVRSLLPIETTVLLLLLSVIVWPIPYLGSVSPSFGLIGLYYWAIYRPDLLRPFIVFVLGIFHDLIHFLPLGLSACVFLGVYQLAFSHRRFFVGQIFYMLWFGFALLSLLAFIANVFFLSLFEDAGVSLLPILLQYVLTCFLFPPVAWVLIWLQRNFLSQG